MLEHLELFFKSIFIDNMVFAVFLGMCSYLAVSKKVTTAVGLGAAVIFVLGVTVPLTGCWISTSSRKAPSHGSARSTPITI